jgi:membrane protein required for colicin V production
MNWLDIVLLLIILASIATSFSKGLTREVVGLASVVAAIFVGIWFYGMAGGWLEPYVKSRGMANFCGFVIVFAGVMLLGAFIGAVLSRLLRATGLSFFDKLLGAGFGAARGVLLAVAVVLALMAFVPGAQAGSPPSAVVNSKVAPYVIDAARIFAAAAPTELKEGFRKSYDEVKSAWGNALKKGHSENARSREGIR